MPAFSGAAELHVHLAVGLPKDELWGFEVLGELYQCIMMGAHIIILTPSSIVQKLSPIKLIYNRSNGRSIWMGIRKRDWCDLGGVGRGPCQCMAHANQ